MEKPLFPNNQRQSVLFKFLFVHILFLHTQSDAVTAILQLLVFGQYSGFLKSDSYIIFIHAVVLHSGRGTQSPSFSHSYILGNLSLVTVLLDGRDCL